jgi:hypothetical protein
MVFQIPHVVRDRVNAAAIHFGVSAAVVAAIFLIARFVYYPHITWELIGPGSIMLLLFSVDVILGPLLTFVVFNKKKASLKMDLAIVVLIQLAALGYGVQTLWQGRPVYIAALGHRFDIVRAFEVQSLDGSPVTNLPKFGPELVGTRLATDPETKQKMLSFALGGADYGFFPEFHTPFKQIKPDITKKTVDLKELLIKNPHRTAELELWFASLKINEKDVVFQGVKGPLADGVVALRRSDIEVIGYGRFPVW